MLPESSLRQLKQLRKETKGKDISDITAKDEIKFPNLVYIGNVVDRDVDSYDDFVKKDNQLQTIAFKSKLVNKPLVNENNSKNMKNVVKFEDFGVNEEFLDLAYLKAKKEQERFKNTELSLYDRDDEDEEEGTFEFDEDEEEITESKKDKEEKQPKYEFLGKEKEPKSDPNFGYAAVRDQEIKKIGAFSSSSKLIDPKTPKERPIGGGVGQFIENEDIKGFVNRIEGKNVYIESVDNPMEIKKFNIKDVVKTKK